MPKSAKADREPILACKDIAYTYPHSKEVFRDINLNAYEDEIVAVVGPTGTGKSTLLRVMAHLLTPTRGHIYLEGTEIREPTPNISLIHQSIATFPWMTALENVRLSLRDTKLPEEEVIKRSEKMLELVGLKKDKDNYPKEMSGGMRQRVAIARALAAEPPVLLLDEPFVHLDEFTAQSLRQEVLRLVFKHRNFLKSAILVSHNLHEVVQLADRVCIVNGTPATVVEELKINLPRPRSERDSKFYEYLELLVKELGLKDYRV